MLKRNCGPEGNKKEVLENGAKKLNTDAVTFGLPKDYDCGLTHPA